MWASAPAPRLVRISLPVVCVAVLATGCSAGVVVPPTTGGALSATAPPTTGPCRASQLDIGGIGSSGAAGNGITTIRIGNRSPASCRISGYPMLIFSTSTGATLTTTTGHLGPGDAFRPPSPVLLAAHTAAAAGFVIISGDFPTDSETSCPVATSLEVTLPDPAGSFTVDTAVDTPGVQLCRPGNPVDVSAIVPNSELDGYAPPKLPST